MFIFSNFCLIVFFFVFLFFHSFIFTFDLFRLINIYINIQKQIHISLSFYSIFFLFYQLEFFFVCINEISFKHTPYTYNVQKKITIQDINKIWRRSSISLMDGWLPNYHHHRWMVMDHHCLRLYNNNNNNNDNINNITINIPINFSFCFPWFRHKMK